MTYQLKLFIVLILILFITYIHINIKKRKIFLKYALLWIVSTIFAIFVTIFPNVFNPFLKIIGMENLSNMMFFLTVIFLSLISFSLTIIVSGQKKKIINLTQELGLIQNQIKKILNERGNK